MCARCVDEERATQVTAFFLSAAGGSIRDYIKLAKLVYYADRTALIELGRTLTRGQHFSLKDGPVVSEVNDLLSGSQHEQAYRGDGYWERHIVCTRADGARLLSDPGTDMLAASDIEILYLVQREHGGKTTDQIKQECHELPEYTEPDEANGRIPITYTRILHEEGVDREQASEIVRKNECMDHLRSLLASVK